MSLIYRGTSSDDVHFNVTERRVYNAPAFDVTGIEVPGRSGDILNSQERFKNKAIVYTGFIRSSDFPGDTTWERLSRGLRTIKAWICGDAGKYHDLTDDYDPGFVRRAFVSGETAISEVLDRPDGATITITFMAEPFMYEESDPIEVPETGTASGAIASFEGVAAPLQSLKFNIEPSQDLHGYSYPWPGGGGKNKLPNTATTATVQGVTYTVRDDGTVSANGTSTGWTGLTIGTVTLPAGSYYLSCDVSPGGSNYFVELSGDATGNTTAVMDKEFTLASQGTVTVKLFVRPNASVSNAVAKPMIRQTTSAAGYEPYSNISPISGRSQVDGKQSGEDMTDYTPITIQLGQTVYGGTLDVTSGKLTVTHAFVEYTGASSENWTRDSASRYDIGITGSYKDGYTRIPCYCNMGKFASSGSDVGTVFLSNSFFYYYQPTSITTLADFRTWLASNHLQVVYQLTTPQEYTLTAQQVSSLLGQNNIWCNTGDTEVVYVEPTENPTEWPSKPRLEITMAGAGTLTVNGKTWSIGAYTGTLICDSEIMDWYDASNLKNSLVSGDGFPEFQPGENVITYTGGITKVVAKPRWRTL